MEKEMCNKLSQIREILNSTNEPGKEKDSGHIVGIFSVLEERNVKWLRTALSTKYFSGLVKKITYISLYDVKGNKLEKMISKFTLCIYMTSEGKWESGASASERETLPILGTKTLILVIDDHDDSSDEAKRQMLISQPVIERYSNGLFLFSKLEKKSDYQKLLSSDRGSPADTSQQAVQTSSRSTIGIFSRSEESDYSWLRALLVAGDSGCKDVRCCRISSFDDETFREVAFQCKFGILYHTMKSGKLRITDVENALYHEELEKLSAKLGKRKVIVVIDDLDDSRDEVKSVVLKKQPSIGRLAGDVFFFTAKEKKYLDGQEKHAQKMANKPTSDKIQRMKEMLNLVKPNISP